MRILLPLALLAASLPALAQPAMPDTLYTGGEMGFDYVQTPFPNYSGTFEAAGPSLGLDGSWQPGQTEAVGGGMTSLDADTVATAIYGVTNNGDTTYDAGLLFIKTVGPLQAGNYPVDVTNGTAAFVFIDDAASFAIPDTLDVGGLVEWFQNLPAAHKLISTSGTIHVATVSADTLGGTFSGTTIDIDNIFFIVNVTGGHFALSGGESATAVTTLPSLITLRAAPNPFNPSTTLSLALPAPQSVAIVVYDAAGRRVRRLWDGPVAAGPQSFAWNGQDDAGLRQPAGVYLVRTTGERWQQSVKITLVP